MFLPTWDWQYSGKLIAHLKLECVTYLFTVITKHTVIVNMDMSHHYRELILTEILLQCFFIHLLVIDASGTLY